MGKSDESDFAKPNNVTPLRPKRPCPNCSNVSQRAYYPFCSKRCSDLDLGKWLDGKYAFPGSEIDTGPHENDEFE